MAGLIGLAVGGVLGHVGQQMREKHEQEQQLKQFQYKNVFDELQQNPNAIDNPEFVKHARKLFGDSWDMLEPTFKVHSAEAKRKQQQSQQIMQQLLGWGGGMPNAPQSGPLQASAPGGPAPAMAPGGAPAAQPPKMDGAATAPSPEDQLNQLEAYKANLPNLGLDPDQVKSMTSVIDDKLKDLREKNKSQQITPYQQQALELRKQEMLMRMGEFQQTNDLRKFMFEQTAQMRQEMAQMHDDEARQAGEARYTQLLMSGKDSLQAKFDDPKFDQKTRAQMTAAWNQSVDQIFRNTKKNKLDLGDPSAFKLGVGESIKSRVPFVGETPGAIGPYTADTGGSAADALATARKNLGL